MDPLHSQRDCHIDMGFDVVDKKDLGGFDGGPLYGLLKNLNGWFLESYLVGQNPFIKGPHHREVRKDIRKVKGIRIGKKAEPHASFYGKDDPGDLLIFCKDIIPNRVEFLKGDREVKVFFDRLKKIGRSDLSHIEVVDDPFLKIEEIGKYFLRILEFFSLSKLGELFCNLIMVERENDIPKIKKDDFNRTSFHWDCI
jgi:hypothetical protein